MDYYNSTLESSNDYNSSYTSPDYSQYYGDKENTEESLMMENWNKNNPYNSNLSWKQNMFGSGIDPRISSGFGWRDMDEKNHNGIDIAVPMNTEIYSPISGVVNNIWNTKAGGLQVSITTPSGERFGFAHLNKTPLKIGMKINQGDFIAKSGTGGTGPHLHFTVTDAKGNKVDPVKYFGMPAWNMKDHVPQYKSSKK
jgi:murein DD-endopeptidase MepM/ murein hydrolase activator NlpD